jgi:hypothetical protein
MGYGRLDKKFLPARDRLENHLILLPDRRGHAALEPPTEKSIAQDSVLRKLFVGKSVSAL